jgi:glycosyltransferase involved in cell wall biosynthesis
MSGRVLVMLNGLTLGGTELNSVDFAWAVRKLGFDSLLVAERAPGKPKPLLDIAAARGLPVAVIDRPRTTLAAARVMTELARRHRADLVHTYGWWNARPSFWGPCRLGRVPLVMTAYEMSLQPQIFPRASLIVGTGYQRDDLAARPGPVHLISPPVDLARDDAEMVQTRAFLTEHELPADHVRLVIVSRLAELMKARGVESAIRAVERLGVPDVDLVVVGGGDAEARMRLLAGEVNARLGRRAIVMTGPLVDPRPAYAAADVVIGMGGSAARGLAFGKPLVAVGESGWSDSFTRDSAARIFRSSFWSDSPVDDAAGLLADNLAPLIRDVALRRALGAFGRGFAIANFGLEAMAERLATVYHEALGRPGRRQTWVADAVGDARLAGLPAYAARRVPVRAPRLAQPGIAGGSAAAER